EVTGRTLLDGDVDVHLVSRAGNGRRLDRYVVEVTQTLGTRARLVDQTGVVPRPFHLDDFATHDLVACPHVAANIQSAYIYATTWIDEDRECDLALLRIDFGRRVHVCKCVTLVAKPVDHGIRSLREHFPR